jgi:hypothetical protein
VRQLQVALVSEAERMSSRPLLTDGFLIRRALGVVQLASLGQAHVAGQLDKARHLFGVDALGHAGTLQRGVQVLLKVGQVCSGARAIGAHESDVGG